MPTASRWWCIRGLATNFDVFRYGSPNKAFYDRLRGAIFAKAYGEDRLVTAMAEDAHPDGSNALNALVKAGQRVDDWLAQGDLVARDTSGDEWASFMAKHARSPNRMAAALREAARIVDAAQQHAKTGDMLGGAEPPSAGRRCGI